MFRKNVTRIIKYGLLSGVAVVGGSAVAGSDFCEGCSNLAPVRMSRAAWTAVDIGRTYNKILYSKEWDTTSDEYFEAKHQAHEIGAEKLLRLCTTNKGVYVKVGQHLASLDYLLPNEYVRKMRILHKDAPANDVKALYKVIKDDLKKDPKEIFVDFAPEPLGTASLAQVHKAKLKDGSEVAVKVQHLTVKANIMMDLKWMEFIIHVMAKVFPEFKMQWLVEETKKNILQELDFRKEGKNAEKVAQMFRHYSWLKIPKVYWEYTSERVLVMECVQGGLVNDLEYITEHKIDPTGLCNKLKELYANMIFVDGYVHSDPHPGNILVKQEKEDKDVTIYLLDHGLYATLDDKFRYNYSKLWLSIINRDNEGMKKFATALGIEPSLYILFVCMISGRPWESILKGIDKVVPTKKEKRIFQNEAPQYMHYITQCLENVDRQALLVMKTNDLIRSLENTLGVTEDHYCKFLYMTKCCIESAYKYEIKNSESYIQKQYLKLRRMWTLFVLAFYVWFNVCTHLVRLNSEERLSEDSNMM